MTPRQTWLTGCLEGLWLVLLLLPNLTIAAQANAWEAPRWQLVATSLWMAVFAWLALPRRPMLALTFPLVISGLVVLGADLLRSVSVLDLLAVSYTFSREEVVDALGPYVWPMAAAVAAVLALATVLWRVPTPRPFGSHPALAIAALAGAALAVALPAESWRSAWPSALAGAVVESQTGDLGIGLPDRADVRVSPRDRSETWHASRDVAPAAQETYVLVIGESVRSDRIPGCGGRPEVTPPPAGSVVYCDVLSGSSSTHVSVPLLVSRDLPGASNRVPRDATLLKAFEAVGFETFWLSMQERSIAWPDARNQAFEGRGGLDRHILLPMLERALAQQEQRKVIVLHAYNAHSPYRDRFDPKMAPFKVLAAGERASSPNERLWNDYDNAIDETMRFLSEVTRRLEAQEGESFLLFTSDHGENMLDDARQLTAHALRVPTLWDTMVPGIAWSNEAWRQRQPERWDTLVANRRAGLMHMDFTPTLLGAAGIRYREPRRAPVDFGAVTVGERPRYTHLGRGRTVSQQQLREEALTPD